jgi:hypothetical protein
MTERLDAVAGRPPLDCYSVHRQVRITIHAASLDSAPMRREAILAVSSAVDNTSARCHGATETTRNWRRWMRHSAEQTYMFARSIIVPSARPGGA